MGWIISFLPQGGDSGKECQCKTGETWVWSQGEDLLVEDMWSWNLRLQNKKKINFCCLLLLLLSHFSRVRLCVTQWTAAYQAPPSLGFSRQERWSGLPFPSPMHESEKWKWSRSVMSDPQWPHGLQPTRLLRPWDFPGTSTGVGRHCLPICAIMAALANKYTLLTS